MMDEISVIVDSCELLNENAGNSFTKSIIDEK